MNKLITTLALVSSLFLSIQASATTLSVFEDAYAASSWDLEGPRAAMHTSHNKSVATLKYNANHMGYQPFEWSFTHVAEVTENVTFDWDWAGNHSWFWSSGTLSFISGDEETLLGLSDGFGSFHSTGTHTAAITAGKTFGWKVTGSHFDFSQKLNGRVHIYNLSGDYSAPVQAVPVGPTAPLFLIGLILIGLVRARANATAI